MAPEDERPARDLRQLGSPAEAVAAPPHSTCPGRSWSCRWEAEDQLESHGRSAREGPHADIGAFAEVDPTTGFYDLWRGCDILMLHAMGSATVLTVRPALRLRRLRRTPSLRTLARENRVHARNLVRPIFVTEVDSSPTEIRSMPGVMRWPVDALARVADQSLEANVGALLLFGIPRTKDASGSGASDENGVVQRAARALREHGFDGVVIADVCLCEYTDHGHCGLVGPDGSILNDPTLERLASAAVSLANAGVDVVAPSAMMDGQVRAIRSSLDHEGFGDTAILAYSAKYASSFYGPFRDAADGAPRFGDRRTHQMDPPNRREALREHAADIEEGADILMVKPGLAYLDVLRDARQTYPNHPLAVYNVSGEYSMVKAAAARGWLDERSAVLETLTAFRRAGADVVITYHALDAARWLAESTA